MTDTYDDPAHRISDEATLRALFPPTHDLAIRKSLETLAPNAQAFIEKCPFICIGTQTAQGHADVSPRGDPAGFVRILDDRTLAIPDRPGNNRLDTLSNIIANPSVGVLFMIPGFDETLRVNGKGHITTDPAILAPMQVNDRMPTLAIVIRVDEVFLHCAKAFRRAKLWDPDALQDRDSLPSLMRFVMEDIAAPPVDAAQMEALDAGLEDAYKKTLY